MKLNNRGVTLVELIISIGLISILITFLFRLLVDVRYTNNNIDFNRENQQKRAIIIKTIQADFLERKLVRLSDSYNSSSIILTFTYGDGTNATLTVNQDAVTYSHSTKGIEKWNLEKENVNSKYDINCVSYKTSIHTINEGEFFFVRFTIPVSTNPNVKNYIDDLEFFYLGEKKGITASNFPNKSSLGNYKNNCR